ncbi:MAG: heavy-metal-associated domain-containing protein [Burkholderiales bacterium]|nr:heavy-metal-associated domain-containing protein [Burkholderiales bacterium]
MEQVIGIEGMSCGGCAASVERALKAMTGVQTVAVDLAARNATVAYDPALVDVTQLKQAIEEAGYDVVA